MRKWLLVTVVALLALALGIWMMPDKRKYAEGLLAEGEKLAGEGNLDQALSKYDEAIRKDPQFALAYYVRAVALMDQQKYEPAIDDLDHAIRLDPQRAPCFALRERPRSGRDKYSSRSTTSMRPFASILQVRERMPIEPWSA
jgi:tetratricopeptide (TPR) repeat protein